MSYDGHENRIEPSRERGNPWTDDDINRLIELWSSGASNADIAKNLSRNENAVAIKASRLRLPPKAVPMSKVGKKPGAAKIRKCLCCTKPFFSEGVGNRICETCKGSSAYSCGDYGIQFDGRY